MLRLCTRRQHRQPAPRGKRCNRRTVTRCPPAPGSTRCQPPPARHSRRMIGKARSMTRIDDGASSVPEPPPFSGLAMLKARQPATRAASDCAVIGTTLRPAANRRAKPPPTCRRCWSTTVRVAQQGLQRPLRDRRRRSAALRRRGFRRCAFDIRRDVHARPATGCRSGGRIGLANRTPAGMIGEMLRLAARYVPPPPGTPSPLARGTCDGLRWLPGTGTARMAVGERDFMFRYRSPAHFVQMFRAWYGPVLKTFAALDTRGQAVLEAELLALLARFSRTMDGAHWWRPAHILR